jgi:hypothetical protein
MIFAPEQSYQLDYATCDYKEGVTGFSAKLLLSVRSWREKLRRCFNRVSGLFVARAMESEVRPTLVTYARAQKKLRTQGFVGECALKIKEGEL